jgi:hypothetical protein
MWHQTFLRDLVISALHRLRQSRTLHTLTFGPISGVHFIPDKFSPLQANGNGLQSVYLTEVPATLAEVLIGLIGQEVAPIAISAAKVKPVSTDDLDSWERKIEQRVVNDPSIGPVSYYPCEEGAGAVQRAGRQNRGEMPNHRRRKSRSSSCEPLQAMAGLDK